MAKKIQLQDASGNVLHPLTLGECVTMDNGENLDTLMSKSQMFTPTIAQDKSMFKVGTGVDVDYSANVKDGVYESLVFKGKSLVNLFDKSKVSPDHTSYTLGSDNTITYVANNGFTNGVKLNHLKPNTKYALFFDVLAVPQEPNIPYRINDDGTNYNINIFGTGQDNPTSGFHSFTTGNDVSDLKFYFYTNLRNVGFKLTLPVIIEYQDGMEDWDIPYFEGLCDSKMPILRNIGKNLFNINGYSTKNQYASINGNTITVNAPTTFSNTVYTLTGLKEGELYRVSLDKTGAGEFSIRDTNGSSLLYVEKEEGHVSRTFTYEKGATIRIGNRQVVNSELSFANIQIEHGSTETAHESYKSNILRTSEEIVLREVGGVCDTYNPLTGEYTKRIGEFILNGSDNETWGNHEVKGDNVKFAYYPTLVAQGTYQFVECLCDKWKADSQANETIQEQISLYNHMPNNTPQTEVRITVSPTRLQSVDATGFRVWLSQNPLTVQYILAEPVTTIIKPSTMTPFAYQNGHVVVESGFEGQSLLPEIEYSVVTGRTGQVTQNTKVLRQQEQQIIGLEELLLTQVVQMEYERTLLQFDYELQMMMLG